MSVSLRKSWCARKRNVPSAADAAHEQVARVLRGRGLRREGARRGAVYGGGRCHPQRLVGALRVELAAEAVEAGLLGGVVRRRGPGRLPLQRPVHSLVAPVLLGAAGGDALMLRCPA